MEFLYFLSFISLAMVVSHAADVAPETYWKSVLPNTPMPKAFFNLLQTDKSTDVHVGVGKGGVSVHAPGTNVGVGKGGVSVQAPGTTVGVGKGGGHVSVHSPKSKPKGKCEEVYVGKGRIIVRCHDKGKGTHVEVSPFSYKYAATDDQLKDDPNVALFFLQKDLRDGNSMNLHFTETTTPSSNFLPRKVADAIPFSSEKLPELYTRFAVKPDTIESESMKKTISECEEKATEGEKRYCATSLEAMVDFSTSELGKNVNAISTDVNSKKLQKYTVKGATKLTGADQAVVCHKQKYPYAVFYCHKSTTTAAYAVGLVGEDGTEGKVVAVCHMDTGKWNPKHLAFRVLKVKPGTTPICHFLPEDHVVWVPY
ncbi:hypothetical protein LXL04_005680 [Taraxacum kok-saghyz]